MKLAGKEVTAPEKRAGLVGAALVLGLAALGNYENPSLDIEGAPGITAPQSAKCTGRLGSLVLSHNGNGPLWRISSIEKVGGGDTNCVPLYKSDIDTQPRELNPGTSIDACNPNDFGYSIRVVVSSELGTTEGFVPVSDDFHRKAQQELGPCLPEK